MVFTWALCGWAAEGGRTYFFKTCQWDSEGRSLFYTNLEKKSKNALPSRLMGACRATGYLGIANLQEISMVKKFATFNYSVTFISAIE